MQRQHCGDHRNHRGGYLIGNQLVIPLFIDTAISSLIFYHLGHVLYNSKALRQQRHPLISLATLTLLTILILQLNVHVEMKYNEFPLYMILLALPMIWSCYQLSLRLSTSHRPLLSNLLTTCGNSSLTIFGLHQALWLILMPAINKLNISPTTSSILLVIFTLPLLIICDKLINRYLPNLYGK